MVETYNTIESDATNIFKEKGSKFIAYAFRVASEQDFKTKLDFCKKKYYDATHHCYAYIINPDNPILKLNDAGEPSGTAGKPIAGQLQSLQLCNTGIIISRYFGGTKLGTGGLSQAYKQSAKEVLANSTITTIELTYTITIACSYEQLHNTIQKIKKNKGQIISQTINSTCELTISISRLHFSTLQQHMNICNIVHIAENQAL